MSGRWVARRVAIVRQAASAAAGESTGNITAPTSVLWVNRCATALTTTGAPSSRTTAGASSAWETTRPGGTGMPCARRNAFASGSERTLRRCARAAAISPAMSPDVWVSIQRHASRTPRSMIDTQNHLAELLSGLEIAMRIRCFLQREYAINHGLQLSSAQKRHHHFKIVFGSAVRANDLQLLMEDVIHRNSAIVGFRSADGHDPAAAREAADRFFQEIAADVLDDEVDTAFFGPLENFVDEVDVLVVDNFVGAELLGALELPVRARRRINVSAGELADLDGGHAHARTRGVDQHGLAGAHIAAIDQHMPRRPEGVGERRRLLEGHGIGQRDQVIGGQLDVLRISPVFVRAEIAVIACTPVVVAGHALLAAPAWKDPPTRYARSHPQIACRLRPERNELAAKIAAENMRKLPLVRLVASRARHQVVAVEAYRMDLDQRFAPFECRHAEVGVFENVGIAILLKNDRLHLLWHQFHLHGYRSGPSGTNGAMSIIGTAASASATRSRSAAKSSLASCDIMRLAPT